MAETRREYTPEVRAQVEGAYPLIGGDTAEERRRMMRDVFRETRWLLDLRGPHALEPGSEAWSVVSLKQEQEQDPWQLWSLEMVDPMGTSTQPADPACLPLLYTYSSPEEATHVLYLLSQRDQIWWPQVNPVLARVEVSPDATSAALRAFVITETRPEGSQETLRELEGVAASLGVVVESLPDERLAYRAPQLPEISDQELEQQLDMQKLYKMTQQLGATRHPKPATTSWDQSDPRPSTEQEPS